jgi:hypothetical protein
MESESQFTLLRRAHHLFLSEADEFSACLYDTFYYYSIYAYIFLMISFL